MNKCKAVAELKDARQASATKLVHGPVTAKVPHPIAQTQDNEDGASTLRDTITMTHLHWQNWVRKLALDLMKTLISMMICKRFATMIYLL